MLPVPAADFGSALGELGGGPGEKLVYCGAASPKVFGLHCCPARRVWAGRIKEGLALGERVKTLRGADSVGRGRGPARGG